MARKLSTFLMFEGCAKEARALYLSAFANAEQVALELYGPEDAGAEGTVRRAEISLCGQSIMLIDSPVRREFGFTPAISLAVEFEDADAFEAACEALSADGAVLMPVGDYGFSRQFAWVADRFGVSWQLNLA